MPKITFTLKNPKAKSSPIQLLFTCSDGRHCQGLGGWGEFLPTCFYTKPHQLMYKNNLLLSDKLRPYLCSCQFLILCLP